MSSKLHWVVSFAKIGVVKGVVSYRSSMNFFQYLPHLSSDMDEIRYTKSEHEDAERF